MVTALSRPGYVDEAEGRAAVLRSELGLGSDAIGDVFELLEHLGLDVVRRPMGEEGPDGFYLQKGDLAIIAVNTSRRLGRQKFTAGHELAHHLFEGRNWIDKDIFADGTVPERRANSFAAFFLMPREGIERWLRRRQRSGVDVETAVHLARHFGVSYQATLVQLLELGFIVRREFAELRQAQPEWIARRLGYDLTPEERERDRQVLPPRYIELALKAYGAGHISLARLAELLRSDEDSARHLVTESGIEPVEPSLEELIEEARNA